MSLKRMGPRKISLPATQWDAIELLVEGDVDRLTALLREKTGVEDLIYGDDRPNGVVHELFVKSASFAWEACLCRAPEWKEAIQLLRV